MIRTIGNIIWLLFGGLYAAIGYITGGIALCLTVIGIPLGLACFKLAYLMLWPFGKKIVSHTTGYGCLTLILNIIWLVSGGLFTVLIHLLFGFLLCITIIGVPFGLQHFKLAQLALSPFGKSVVDD